MPTPGAQVAWGGCDRCDESGARSVVCRGRNPPIQPPIPLDPHIGGPNRWLRPSDAAGHATESRGPPRHLPTPASSVRRRNGGPTLARRDPTGNATESPAETGDAHCDADRADTAHRATNSPTHDTRMTTGVVNRPLRSSDAAGHATESRRPPRHPEPTPTRPRPDPASLNRRVDTPRGRGPGQARGRPPVRRSPPNRARARAARPPPNPHAPSMS